MPVLALDTSGAVAAAIVADDGAALAQAAVTEPRRQAEELGPMIADLLARAGLGPRDLSRVVVGTGPAPFTGLRVGLVTARTFALAAGLPVVGVCSLDALAQEAEAPVGTRVLVATDARRKEIYWRSYVVDAEGRAIPDGEPSVGTAAAVAAELDLAGTVVVGAGGVLYREELTAAGALVRDAPVTPDPVVLAGLAARALADGVELPVQPLYLRRPDAQVPNVRKRATA